MDVILCADPEHENQGSAQAVPGTQEICLQQAQVLQQRLAHGPGLRWLPPCFGCCTSGTGTAAGSMHSAPGSCFLPSFARAQSAESKHFFSCMGMPAQAQAAGQTQAHRAQGGHE
jgi:hypothetical protein